MNEVIEVLKAILIGALLTVFLGGCFGFGVWLVFKVGGVL